ncbi:MAG: dihydroxyacetone kinase subunit L [Betaproteobacteria bacterium]|jgi:dihydroxyacetone kinase-like protein|nr:dihydroxyacetone kinase subunit L [Betaproteobacteria bacterium]NCX68823.1 dihydroxyacetone kinase subunit L [Betaproteobacteria bacterium]
MSVEFLISQAKLIQEVIDINAIEIEKLDQEIGDGDHIFNVQRGIKLVIELEATIKELPISKALNQIAMKVLSGIGGSSGALFGTLFMTMAKGENIDQGVDYKKAIEIFVQGVEAVKQRGKADVGEKTMMDVLIPVAKCLQDGVQNNKDVNEILIEAVQVAEKGMLSTKDLLATKGRASFLGERARGHIDPGARSSQLMIKTVCEAVIQK